MVVHIFKHAEALPHLDVKEGKATDANTLIGGLKAAARVLAPLKHAILLNYDAETDTVAVYAIPHEIEATYA